MQKTYIRWIVALLITLSAAVYQRLTGPTHPFRGTDKIGSTEVQYKFNRSHGGASDQPVAIVFSDTSFQVFLNYKRYKTTDKWTSVPMLASADSLLSALPHQPPAGKLEYYIEARKNEQSFKLPSTRTIVTRFKGAVPESVLTPHIFFMFLAMLISTLAALEAIVRSKTTLRYTLLATSSLLIGGMIFGPIVQKYAFGEYWTGVPFGWDLTDNKTLVAMIGWLVASGFMLKDKASAVSRYMVIGAAVLLMAMYSIPHSVMGSEFDYEKNKVVTGNTD